MKKDPNLRLTVVDSIYYQQPGMDPTQIDAGYTRFIQDNEQLFQRIGFADIVAKPLETGWIKQASCVIIQNRHLLDISKNPSEAELAERPKHVLQLFYEDSKYRFFIHPGESMRFSPENLSKLLLSSAYGLTRYICSVIPE